MKKILLLLLVLINFLKGYSQADVVSVYLPGNSFLNYITMVNEDPAFRDVRISTIDNLNSNPYALVAGGSKDIG